MKKLLSIFVLMVTLFTSQCLFVSCERDDDDPYYAGESEEDYLPAEYSITSEWDFSKVSGFSDVEKQLLKSQFEDALKATSVFSSRVEAVKAFDKVVEELRTNDDFKISGLKCKLYLKRGGAIIKSANFSW